MTTVATEIRPRPVFCVVDHLYRDRGVADAVRLGRFTHAASTLDLGLEPDWQVTDWPSDPEWRIEWRKFYYGLDLAHAYATSGDDDYRVAWERLVRSWIQQMPADADRSDVTARRVLNWLYAWQRFSAAPSFHGLSEGLAEQLVVSIGQQLEHVRTHLTAERNHRTFELYALLLSTLALPQVDVDDTRAFALQELHRNLLTDVRPDGVHREASTHYHHVALRTYLGVYENARRYGLQLPDTYRERLTRACEFAMHCHRPDGGIPALSDSDSGSYLDLLHIAGTLLGRADFVYVATAGTRGKPPQQRVASFPDGGYFTQCSGWGETATAFKNERYLIFDCGPLGDGGHGHYDLLNVEIAAGGTPLIVDPGRYVYSEDAPNWRRWFKSTMAHNTVTVDGTDQTPYRRGAPRGLIAEGRLLQRLTVPGLDVLWGEARSPMYEVVHQRRVLFVLDEYWLIEDRLVGERPHSYDLRFHLSPGAWGQTTLRQSVVQAPGLTLVVDGGRVQLEDGWVAPTYGHKVPAPVVSARVDDVADAVFITLVLPGGAVPELQVHRDADRTRVEVNGRDFVVWSATGDAGVERRWS